MIAHLASDSIWFPSPRFALADPNGLLAVGGDLAPARLIAAYQQGIFPWFGEDDPLLWWSPDPRCVFSPTSLHVSRSMRRFIRTTNLQVTINQDFAGVIQACAEVHAQAERGVWIHPEMIAAYQQLHQLGHAHAIEVWQQGQLVGGLYGVAVNNLFCAESMFQRVTNASKFALLRFAQAFFTAGGSYIDAQIMNPHTASLGAFELARAAYLTELAQPQRASVKQFWQQTQL